MTARACRTFALVLLGLTAASAEEKDFSKNQISSVLQVGDQYIASADDGLYQASATEKVWRKIPTPATMPPRGRLVQISPVLPTLAYHTGFWDLPMAPLDTTGSLFLSKDGGKSWTESPLHQPMREIFLHPNGSLFAITHNWITTAPPPGSYAMWMAVGGVKYYPSSHLLLSRDEGRSWRDITPPLDSCFELYGLFQDPDHPGLACVFSAAEGHTSRSILFQADNDAYGWEKHAAEDWHGGRELRHDFAWRPFSGGSTITSVPATLLNFFQFPYSRSGHNPDLPNHYLVSDKTAYEFPVGGPMPIPVQTFFMFPKDGLRWIDNSDTRVFWGLNLQPEGEIRTNIPPRTGELNVNIPDRDAKIEAYWGDPNLTIAQVDQEHPYRRVIDLRDLASNLQPGRYRLQIFHSDQSLDRSGSTMGTGAIDLTVTP